MSDMILADSRRILYRFVIVAGLVVPALLPASEADRAAEWAMSFETHPPVSFIYGGRPSSEWLPAWRREIKVAGSRREITYTDPATGLVLRAVTTVFRDSPAVETVLYFRNSGTSDTPILEDVRALDARLPARGRDPILYYAKGATCSMDDFMPMRRVFNKKGLLHLQPGGGRSSSDYLPFVNIETQGEGMIVGLG